MPLRGSRAAGKLFRLRKQVPAQLVPGNNFQ
jgi:hypothetical protein